MPEIFSIPMQFLEEHVGLLLEGKTTDLAQRYTEDAMVVRFDRVANGRAEIKELFDDYAAENPQITDLDGLRIHEDVILYQAAEHLSDRTCTAVGTMVFRGNLIWRQTVTFVEHRPS